MSSNILLKHDNSELSQLLAEAREEGRVLREELEQVHAGPSRGPSPTIPAGYSPLSTEMLESHTRRAVTSPMTQPRSWGRMSMVGPSRTISAWEHHRRSSMTPSLMSSSTAERPSSPGLGLGPVHETLSELSETSRIISPTSTGRNSPQFGVRGSAGVGIGYMRNGVPRRPSVRHAPGRSISVDRSSMASASVSISPRLRRSY